jgi:hypothetical protein
MKTLIATLHELATQVFESMLEFGAVAQREINGRAQDK